MVKLKKILLPVERILDDSYEVIDEAVELAKKFDSEITIFHVNNSDIILKSFNSDLKAEFDISIDKKVVSKKQMVKKDIDSDSFIEDIKKKYELEGLKVESKIVKGDPASMIIDEIENGDYNLIIMKTHEMKSQRRFLIGSVTNKVVHHAKIPILVVR